MYLYGQNVKNYQPNYAVVIEFHVALYDIITMTLYFLFNYLLATDFYKSLLLFW